jgi:hypothetical protein
MRLAQIAEITMVKGAQAYYTLKKEKILPFGPLNESWEQVNAKMSELENYLIVQSVDTSARTGTKGLKREELENELDYLGDLFAGFCAKQKLTQQRAQALNIVGQRLKSADLELVVLAQQFQALVNPYIAQAASCGLSPTDLDRLGSMTSGYEEMTTGNRLTRAQKADSTKNIYYLLKDVLYIFREEIDRLMVVFKRNDPAMYDEYVRLRHIAYRRQRRAETPAGTATTADVTVIVLDAATLEPIAGATVADGNTVLPEPTDQDGETTEALTPGKHQLTAIANGYSQAAAETELLEAGKEYRIEIPLTKQT